MYIITLAAKLAVAVTLIAAGSAKLADLGQFASTARLFLPPGLVPAGRAVPATRTVAGLIAVGELAVGCASLAAPRAGWVNWVVLGLATLFIVISVVGYARYRNRSCNCFGGLSRRKFDRRGIARSLLIAAGGGVATLPVPASAVRLSAADASLLLAAAILAGCATFAAAKAVAAVSSALPPVQHPTIGLAMVVPVYLELAQWALLLLLGLLVIIMFRQLGRLFNRESRQERATLIGTKAPDFGYLRVGDNRELEFPAASGQPTLIAFVDPTCPSCEELVANLGEVASAGELPGFRVLLLTADPPSYLHISEIFQSTRLELGAMTSRETRAAFDAATTPLLVAIDPAGFIRASDHARGRTEILGLASAATLPPADSMIELKPVTSAAE